MNNLIAEDINCQNTLYIKATNEKVWNALVVPVEVSKYYMCPMINCGTKIGDPIEFGVANKVMIGGHILNIIVNDTFSYSFKFEPNEIDSDENYKTNLNIKISEDKGITKFILVHSGFKDKGQSYADIVDGWPWILSNMKAYIETGKTLNEK